MARPREFDRDAALLKAQEAFWARGYEGTSMADLVEVMGIASARIYAAYGSKAELFREAVALYETHEGSFVERALAEESRVIRAVERIMDDAAKLYTRRGKPRGCLVVTSATNCAAENEGIGEYLSERRRRQTSTIKSHLERAVETGELKSTADTRLLGDYISAVMHGLSVQARDGVSRKRLCQVGELAVRTLELSAAEPGESRSLETV